MKDRVEMEGRKGMMNLIKMYSVHVRSFQTIKIYMYQLTKK